MSPPLSSYDLGPSPDSWPPLPTLRDVAVPFEPQIDNEHIKRPSNTFLLFRNWWNKMVTEKEQRKLSTNTSSLWKTGPQFIKDHFYELQRLLKQEHAQMYPLYRYCPGRNEKRNGRKREDVTKPLRKPKPRRGDVTVPSQIGDATSPGRIAFMQGSSVSPESSASSSVSSTPSPPMNWVGPPNLDGFQVNAANFTTFSNALTRNVSMNWDYHGRRRGGDAIVHSRMDNNGLTSGIDMVQGSMRSLRNPAGSSVSLSSTYPQRINWSEQGGMMYGGGLGMHQGLRPTDESFYGTNNMREVSGPLEGGSDNPTIEASTWALPAPTAEADQYLAQEGPYLAQDPYHLNDRSHHNFNVQVGSMGQFEQSTAQNNAQNQFDQPTGSNFSFYDCGTDATASALHDEQQSWHNQYDVYDYINPQVSATWDYQYPASSLETSQDANLDPFHWNHQA